MGTIRADGTGRGHRLHIKTKIKTLQIEDRKLQGLASDGIGVLRRMDLEHGKAVQMSAR